MFKLYPSEESILVVKSDPVVEVKRKSRYLLVLGVILLAVGVFYQFASTQDYVLLAVAWAALIGGVGSIVAYFLQVAKAKKNGKVFTYYITNTRVVKVDENDQVDKEVVRAKIKRVVVENVTGKSGNVIINPRELSAQDRYKQELKGEVASTYTKDTFVVSNIKNSEEFAAKLKA